MQPKPIDIVSDCERWILDEMNPLVITQPFASHVSDNLFLLVADHNGHVIDSGHRECFELVIQDRSFVNFNQTFRMFPVHGANPGTLTRS
jgi:hypothetical protein